MSDKYADLRAALENAERGLNVAFDGRHSFFKKETIRALLDERDKYASVLEGLPQDAIDGGWTAKGISAYAKELEAQRDRLREALEWYASMAKQMGKAAIHQDSQSILTLMKEIAVDYGKRARDALAQEKV